MLADRGLDRLAPALVDALDHARTVILVLEYVDGPSLLRCKLAGELTVDQLDRAWATLDEFHAGGVYLGDAKLANFLTTPDGGIRALDFEAAGVVGDRAPAVRTFFVEAEPDDPLLADRTHFLASVLYPYEEGRYSWQDRHVELHSWVNREPADAVAAWAIEKLTTLPWER